MNSHTWHKPVNPHWTLEQFTFPETQSVQPAVVRFPQFSKSSHTLSSMELNVKKLHPGWALQSLRQSRAESGWVMVMMVELVHWPGSLQINWAEDPDQTVKVRMMVKAKEFMLFEDKLGLNYEKFLDSPVFYSNDWRQCCPLNCGLKPW